MKARICLLLLLQDKLLQTCECPFYIHHLKNGLIISAIVEQDRADATQRCDVLFLGDLVRTSSSVGIGVTTYLKEAVYDLTTYVFAVRLEEDRSK